MKDKKNSAAKAKGLRADVNDMLTRIDKNFSNPAQLNKTCKLLYEVLNQGSAQWDQVDMDRVICSAMRVFKTYPNEVAILEPICVMLGTVCKSNSTRCSRFQKEGGVEAIMHAMHNHKGMATQVAIWCALGSIAEQKGILGNQQVGNVAKHMSVTMQTHAGDILAQQVGAYVLQCLCTFEENTKQLMQGNVVRAVVSATRTMCQHDKICANGFGAMQQLSASADAAKLLLEEGVPDLMISIMDKIMLGTYIEDSPIPLDSDPERLLNVCCSTIGALLKAHAVRDSQTCSTLIAVISRVMLKFVENASLQHSAMCALERIAICESNYDNTSTEYSSKQQGIRAILAGLVQHKHNPAVQHAGMHALATMCGTFSRGNSAVTAGVIADEGMRVLLQHMDAHLQDSSVQHAGIEAIVSITTRGDVHMTEFLIEAGCVKRVVLAMNAHVDLPYHHDGPENVNDVLCTGCEALSKIISPELGHDARTTMVEDGVAGALILAMIRRDLDYATISVNVCRTLSILLLNHAQNIKRVGAAVLHAAVYALQIVPVHAKLQACYDLVCILKISAGAEDFRSYQDVFCKCGGFEAVTMSLKICLKNYKDCLMADRSFRRLHASPHALAALDGMRDLEACQKLVNYDWLDTCTDETEEERCSKDAGPAQEAYSFFDSMGVTEECSLRDILQTLDIDLEGLSLAEIMVKNGTLIDPDDDRCEWMARLACQCLYQAARDHAQNQEHCGEAMICSVLRVMAKLSEDDQVQEAGTHALYAICHRNDSNMGTIKSLGGHAHILRAGQTPYNCDVTDEELTILKKKFPGVGMSKAMIRPGDVKQSDQDMVNQNATEKEGEIMAARTKKGPGQKHMMGSSLLTMEEKGIDACVACGKTAGSLGVRKLLKCSACTIEPVYCSAECQKVCWGAHKAECKLRKKP